MTGGPAEVRPRLELHLPDHKPPYTEGQALAEAQRALEQHAKSHPVVEKAVALFGGEVRQVKRR